MPYHSNTLPYCLQPLLHLGTSSCTQPRPFLFELRYMHVVQRTATQLHLEQQTQPNASYLINTWSLHDAMLLHTLQHVHLQSFTLLIKPCFLQQAVVRGCLQVSLFSENSSRWLVADQAIMLCGAADAVRGASSPPDELAYIMRQSDSSGKNHTAASAHLVSSCCITQACQLGAGPSQVATHFSRLVSLGQACATSRQSR